MNQIEVIINYSPIKREIFGFYFGDEFHLWLDSYSLELRKTPRHKFRSIENYDRLDSRDSTLREDQVILSDEIKEKAKQQLLSQIRIQKWSERIRRDG